MFVYIIIALKLFSYYQVNRWYREGTPRPVRGTSRVQGQQIQNPPISISRHQKERTIYMWLSGPSTATPGAWVLIPALSWIPCVAVSLSQLPNLLMENLSVQSICKCAFVEASRHLLPHTVIVRIHSLIFDIRYKVLYKG